MILLDSELLLDQVKLEHGEEYALQMMHNDQHFKRLFLKDRLFLHWGKRRKHAYLPEDPVALPQSHYPYHPLPPLSHPSVTYMAFSDQKACLPFIPFSTHLLGDPLRNIPFWPSHPNPGGSRISLAITAIRKGTTFFERFIMPFFFVFFEPFQLAYSFISVSCVALVRFLLFVGIRVPLLSFLYFSIVRSGINGKESLSNPENGYTRLFRGGENINIQDLERELMTRNSNQSTVYNLKQVNIIAISYKHYANRGKIPGDDNRICRSDLRAIAMLIKAAAPCHLRLWIDSKLPPTTDASFERWINRGVRPYGLYITFICPSALESADSSFWIANEREFALAGKGVMIARSDQIYFGTLSTTSAISSKLRLNLRLMQIIVGAENIPAQVRDQDKNKVIHWAMCCLRGGLQEVMFESTSPAIDRLEMVGKNPHELILLWNIRDTIRTFGAQELPVVAGRSWNKQNPLLMGDVSHQEIDLTNWYGLCLDGCPTTIYFVHQRTEIELRRFRRPMAITLEVNLDRPHFNPGTIRVTRKVLREIEITTLLESKLVTLPWLCDWE